MFYFLPFYGNFTHDNDEEEEDRKKKKRLKKKTKNPVKIRPTLSGTILQRTFQTYFVDVVVVNLPT